MKGLVGYTGFVGSNLMKQTSFHSLYNSKNIESIKGKTFDLLVFSGARAEKWLANASPDEDATHINSLIENLSTVSAKTAVLISSVDVYKTPVGVDEESPTAHMENHSYGKNRGRLEDFFCKHFENHLIIRLPGLFGTGLKKNVIFDFLNNNNIEKIDSRGLFQFYNLEHIWDDIQKALANQIKVLNMATEPISVSDVAKKVFGQNFNNEILARAASYDFKSRHFQLWSGFNGYLYSQDQILKELYTFVQNYKKAT